MSSIRENAREAATAFEEGTRPDGETFRRLREPRPEWVFELVRHAHGGMLPDDWRYRTIERALDAIADAGDDDDTRETIEDERHEFADAAADIYTAAGLAWLASDLTRLSYVDDAVRDYGGEVPGIAGMIALGQSQEAGEIFGLVLERLAELSEDEDEDEDERAERMAAFIAENRAELVAAIRAAVGDNCPELDDDDLEQWIANDEGLYNWARSQGVPV